MRNKDRENGAPTEGAVFWGSVREKVRHGVRALVEEVLQEELTAALGAGRHVRGERRGYRNGRKSREVATGFGTLGLEVPRGRLFEPEGRTREWVNGVLPRYARRTADVDAAILNCYLTGVNTRKVKAALRPLLGRAPLSASAVSRIVARLATQFEAWKRRSLKDERIAVLVLDGFGAKVRLGGKVVSVPVLAALGFRENGEKVLLSLELAGSEATASWEGFLRDLEGRGLRAPILAIADGNPGLLRALSEVWPRTKVQRCIVHKLRNLLAKAPRHLRAELTEEYRAFIYAETPEEVRAGHERFLSKWDRKCPGVAASLREAGEALLTFAQFPSAMWKGLRTTNALERINGEFRRRVKTQGSFPSEQAVVVMLYALIATGLLKMRKIPGWLKMPEVLLAHGRQAA